MPYVEDKTYDTLAKQAVDAFTGDSTPLTDSVYKIAEDVGMLPDQVKQLVWRTNTLAHLTLFDKQAEDKNVAFPVASATDVLSRLYNNTEEKTAQAYAARTKERTLDFFTSVDTGINKEAAAEDTTITPAFADTLPRYVGDKKTSSMLILHKVAEELEQTALIARENFLESALILEDSLKKIAAHPERGDEIHEFAHEVLSTYGNPGKDLLSDLGIKTTEAMEKTSAVADLSDPLHATFKRALNEKRAVYKAAEALRHLEDKIDSAV